MMNMEMLSEDEEEQVVNNEEVDLDDEEGDSGDEEVGVLGGYSIKLKITGPKSLVPPKGIVGKVHIFQSWRSFLEDHEFNLGEMEDGNRVFVTHAGKAGTGSQKFSLDSMIQDFVNLNKYTMREYHAQLIKCDSLTEEKPECIDLASDDEVRPAKKTKVDKEKHDEKTIAACDFEDDGERGDEAVATTKDANPTNAKNEAPRILSVSSVAPAPSRSQPLPRAGPSNVNQNDYFSSDEDEEDDCMDSADSDEEPAAPCPPKNDLLSRVKKNLAAVSNADLLRVKHEINSSNDFNVLMEFSPLCCTLLEELLRDVGEDEKIKMKKQQKAKGPAVPVVPEVEPKSEPVAPLVLGCFPEPAHIVKTEVVD